jgi:hypothetical protein
MSALILIWILYVAVLIVWVAGYWMMFQKADRPGWAAIIPIYNFYTMCKIAGRPGWWWVLLFIPIVNIVIGLIVSIDLARSYARGTGFGVGLFFLGFIFAPIIGFGEDRYLGPAAAA